MSFKRKDKVSITGHMPRKKSTASKGKPVELVDNTGTIVKVRKHKNNAAKNTYHVKNKYGTHIVHSSKLKLKDKK